MGQLHPRENSLNPATPVTVVARGPAGTAAQGYEREKEQRSRSRDETFEGTRPSDQNLTRE
jgi:hypothetical protein